ncbi:MAG: EamA family transporter [Chitinophagaceae bacterium]|nr:EamA family transporter [Chitinophagaceae bacterium]
MARFDISKIIVQSGNNLKKLTVFNPLTIHKKGSKAKAVFALALVCIFWGTTWVASKVGVQYMPALQLSGIRQLLGGLCFVTIFMAKGAKLPRGREWGVILILALLNFTFSNGLSTWSVQYISAGLGSIMAAIFPLWLVVIGLFGKSSRMPPAAIIGLLLGFAGVCIIFYERLGDFLIPDFRFGILLSLIATWTWAFGTIYTKKHATRYNPYLSMGLQMVISGVITTVITQILHAQGVYQVVPISSIPWQAWASIAFLVVFGSIIAFVAYIYALQRLPAEQVSIYAYINPVVAILLGAMMFNEPLTIFIAVGGGITLLGVYLVNRAFKIGKVKS